MTNSLRTLVLRSLVVILLLGGLTAERPLHSQTTAAEPAAVGMSEHEAEKVSPPTATGPKEKKVKAFAGLFALAGIVIVGLFLLAFTVLWASRLRRQLRRPLPASDPPERDFWFLKPPKAPVQNSSLPEFESPPPSPQPPSSDT